MERLQAQGKSTLTSFLQILGGVQMPETTIWDDLDINRKSDFLLLFFFFLNKEML